MGNIADFYCAAIKHINKNENYFNFASTSEEMSNTREWNTINDVKILPVAIKMAIQDKLTEEK